CGGLLRKLISPPAIQFKGNGWYITDYAKKTGSAPEGQGQAKPEAKREPAKEKEAAPNPPASAKD
ncbi:MAG TPA: hypothetical protein VEG35_00775, partial [Burkholderiales bacterium]|nr:hypothetical protein [Burkholderiales bacterium]